MTSRFLMRGWLVSGACLLALTSIVGVRPASARPAPFPVPVSGAYVGAFTGSESGALSEFDSASQKNHAFFMRFVAVGEGAFDEGESSCADFVKECEDVGAIPYFTIEPFNASSAGLLEASDIEWVREFARAVGRSGRPAFVRFAHEMNGDWYPWGWGSVQPVVYVSGFRQVSDIFRVEAPEAAMVWAPSQNWGSTTADTYSDWYPGDDWVDWVGLTTYQWPYSGLSPRQFLDSISYGSGSEGDFYKTFAVGHSKPMVIAETGCGDDAEGYYDGLCYGSEQDEVGTYGTALGLGAQQWWIRQVYSVGSRSNSTSGRFPGIKAIAWFAHEDVGEGVDFQVGGYDPASHSVGYEAYREAVSDPYWVAAVPDPAVRTSVHAVGSITTWRSADVTIALEATSSNAAPPLTTSYSIGVGPASVYTGPLLVSSEGTTAVQFFSQDAAGVREATQTVLVRIDKTRPLLSDDHVSSYRGSASITIAASDALSGVAKTEWCLDGGTWTTGNVAHVASAGEHRLGYRVSDNAGNVASVTTSPFEVQHESVVALSSKSATSLQYGSAFGVRGELRSNGYGLVGRRVVLETAAPGKPFKPTTFLATTHAGGTFSFTVRPATRTHYRVRFAGSLGYAPSRASASVCAMPRAWVGTPAAPPAAVHSAAVKVRGHLKPKHPRGSYPVRIYRWKRNASGSWRRFGAPIRARASDDGSHTEYSCTVKLPSAGRWRVRAYAPADSGHAAAWSSAYEYVRVK